MESRTAVSRRPVSLLALSTAAVPANSQSQSSKNRTPHASPLLSSITLSVSKAKNKEVKEQISKGRGARGSAKRKMTDRAQHGLPSGPYSRHCVAPETAWWDPKALCVSTEPGIEWAHNQVCTLQLRKVFIHHNCVLSPTISPNT